MEKSGRERRKKEKVRKRSKSSFARSTASREAVEKKKTRQPKSVSRFERATLPLSPFSRCKCKLEDLKRLTKGHHREESEEEGEEVGHFGSVFFFKGMRFFRRELVVSSSSLLMPFRVPCSDRFDHERSRSGVASRFQVRKTYKKERRTYGEVGETKGRRWKTRGR